MPFYPMYHVPWLLFAVVGLFLWRRAGGHLHSHHGHQVGPTSSVMDH
jgi:hypothetical protein